MLAHVPDLNDFVAGMKRLLKPTGVITMEFPHLLRLMEQNQFDTIYHEHFSYFSFLTVDAGVRGARADAVRCRRTADARRLDPHLRAPSAECLAAAERAGAEAARARARNRFQPAAAYLSNFGEQVKATKRKLLSFLIDLRNQGKSIVGYGAPGKGNTLLNYCGIRTDLLDYTVDRNPYKQGKYTPGTHIPILAPEKIRETRPDYVLILPWNLKDEITSQMSYIRDWGGRFIIPIPAPQII